MGGENMPELERSYTEDHVQIKANPEKLNNLNVNIQDLKGRMDKLEDKYDLMLEMTSHMKVLSNQMVTINDNVECMKTQVEKNIQEIKEDQKIITTKVDKLEIASNTNEKTNADKHAMMQTLKYDVIKYLVITALVILLIQLFPHLSGVIK